MTVSTFQPGPTALDLAGLPSEMAAIVQWANTAAAAQQLVEMIVDTPFMPAAFWPKFDPRDREAATHARHVAVASGTAAVLYGGPLGLNPLQALANINVIKGKPGLPAELMVALIRAAGHEVAVEDLTDHRCRVWGKRRGSETVHRAEFTIDRAKKAGYTAQNTKYNTDPQAMLYARAMSILCRQIAPEELKGLATVEELGDEDDSSTPVKTTTRTVQRAAVSAAPAAPAAPALPAEAPVVREPQQAPTAPAQPAPSGLPPLPGEDEPPATEQPDGDGITDPQLRKLGAVFGELGVTGTGSRELRLRIAADIAGRELSSSKDLTKAEARIIIDTLEADGGTIVARFLEPTTEASDAVENQDTAGVGEQPVDGLPDPADGDDPWAGQS